VFQAKETTETLVNQVLKKQAAVVEPVQLELHSPEEEVVQLQP
jgi:hypothetical protein